MNKTITIEVLLVSCHRFKFWARFVCWRLKRRDGHYWVEPRTDISSKNKEKSQTV